MDRRPFVPVRRAEIKVRVETARRERVAEIIRRNPLGLTHETKIEIERRTRTPITHIISPDRRG